MLKSANCTLFFMSFLLKVNKFLKKSLSKPFLYGKKDVV